MSSLQLPEFAVGMIVVTPSSQITHLTEDRKYVIEDIDGDWLSITDDTGDSRFYQSHIFIEADVYYNMLLFLTMIRLFDINPNQLK